MSSPRIREHKITNSQTSLPRVWGLSYDFLSEWSHPKGGHFPVIVAGFMAPPAMG